MAIRLEQIKVGAAFRFKHGVRRVVARKNVTDRGFTVQWSYVDGQPRGGRLGGEQWCHYFRKDAIEELPHDEIGSRTLKSGRVVACEAETKTISIRSRCPAKWVMVDLETGDVWVPEGDSLKRAGDEVVKDLSLVVASG